MFPSYFIISYLVLVHRYWKQAIIIINIKACKFQLKDLEWIFLVILFVVIRCLSILIQTEYNQIQTLPFESYPAVVCFVLLTIFAIFSVKPTTALALITSWFVRARSSIQARASLALIDIWKQFITKFKQWTINSAAYIFNLQ